MREFRSKEFIIIDANNDVIKNFTHYFDNFAAHFPMICQKEIAGEKKTCANHSSFKPAQKYRLNKQAKE